LRGDADGAVGEADRQAEKRQADALDHRLAFLAFRHAGAFLRRQEVDHQPDDDWRDERQADNAVAANLDEPGEARAAPRR
jgi:hypothetical protein